MSHAEFMRGLTEPYGSKAGTLVWRIENMLPALVKKEDHGKFCTGDSYIVLNSKQSGCNLKHDIHFWLGKETTKDEMGAAALKTIELDDSLGGMPVQYREVQEHETDMFLSIFKGGVRYLEGGVESAFKKVERDQFRTRLLHLKGKKAVRVREVPIECASLNEGDVFVLDCGLTIYQWNGKDSSRKERAKGLDVTINIRDNERGARAKIVVIDGSEEEADTDAFWAAIGGKGRVMSADEAGDDEEHENRVHAATKLYRVSDANGSLEVSEEATGTLMHSMLDTNDCFILDLESEIYVWVGKKSTHAEKKQSMKHAVDFLEKFNRPVYTPISRCIEGGEPPMFKTRFKTWPSTKVKSGYVSGSVRAEEKSAPAAPTAIDVKALHQTNYCADQGPDDGSGTLKMWRIEDFKMVEVDAAQHGQLWSGDSFIFLYTYMNRNKEAYIIYFWQGRDSSKDEKGASALLATELDDKYDGAPVQIRVVQGKEPAHFCKIFNGKLIIHSGGVPSGFKNAGGEAWEYETEGLFRVRSTGDVSTTRVMEIDPVASNLNSNDVFIFNGESQFIWYGKGASDIEKSAAEAAANELLQGRSSTSFDEGSEPAEFWAALGGQCEYASHEALVTEERDPRLFQCSNASGSYKVEEVFNFAQDDLDFSDVFILDTFNTVYVWIGSQANEEEKKRSLETAVEYVKSADDGRDEDIPISMIKCGNEPVMFYCHFPAWDMELAQSGEDPLDRKLREAGKAPAATDAADALADYSKKYSYEELKNKPSHLDPTQLEANMKDEDFVVAFGIDKSAFEALPKWKKMNFKKKAGLF